MSARESGFDRRRATRRQKSVAALVGPRHARPATCENAFVEDVSRGGMRVRSARSLAPGDSPVLYVGGLRQAVAAKVRWVRRHGLIVRRDSGKPSQAYVAGCALSDAPAPRPAPAAPRGSVPAAVVIWSMRIGAGLVALGLVALLAWLVILVGALFA